MIHLGKSIIPLPLSMKFTTFFLSIAFSLVSSLNFCKPSSWIFGLTEKCHAENRIFTSQIPEKFLNAEQEVECASQIFTCYH